MKLLQIMISQQDWLEANYDEDYEDFGSFMLDNYKETTIYNSHEEVFMFEQDWDLLSGAPFYNLAFVEVFRNDGPTQNYR